MRQWQCVRLDSRRWYCSMWYISIARCFMYSCLYNFNYIKCSWRTAFSTVKRKLSKQKAKGSSKDLEHVGTSEKMGWRILLFHKFTSAGLLLFRKEHRLGFSCWGGSKSRSSLGKPWMKKSQNRGSFIWPVIHHQPSRENCGDQILLDIELHPICIRKSSAQRH